jgi:Na+/H+-dicarboxylate symporter
MSRSKRPAWLSSTALIFYALILGVVLGHFLPAERYPGAYETFRFMSKAFINLIKMLIVPLILSTIIVGIGKTGDIKAVGRMGVKAILYFEIATTAALALGLAIAHIVRPGDGLTLPHSPGETSRSRRRSPRRCCTSFPPTSSTRWCGRTSFRSSSSRRSSASRPRTSAPRRSSS